MNIRKYFNALACFYTSIGRVLGIVLIIPSSLFLASCGGPDAEPTVKKFCAQVKAGEPIMGVVTRAENVDFDKYWLEKFDKEPSKGENIGIIRPRDLEKKTEKLNKLGDPKEWKYGQLKGMIQELGYSRHICTVDFAKGKVLKQSVHSVD